MENLMNLFTDIGHQLGDLVAAGQTLVDGLGSAVSALTQLASLVGQVIDFLPSLSSSPPM
ncbi:MAG: hypothetical protein IBX36_00010 [Dehalococcoidia bacterium]|nr:hypothetical protein [Dehalococcoidia bacterium]